MRSLTSLDSFTQLLDPVSAGDAAHALGALAPFWLNSDACELMSRDPAIGGPQWRLPPSLPAYRGGCWVMLVNKVVATQAILRQAMLLPLRWERDAEHDPRLPPTVRQVADEAIQAARSLKDYAQLADSSWGLRPAELPGYRFPDLAGLSSAQLDASSGWAPIAGSLIMAALERPEATQCQPHSGVWATGCWDAAGIARVGGLQEKVDLAIAHGAAQLFVPEHQFADAIRHVRSRNAPLRIGKLREGRPNVLEALGQYLVAHVVRPPSDANRNDKRRYHRLVHRFDREASETYYQDELVPLITRDCRSQATWGEERPTHLITIASGRAEAVRLAIEIVAPKHCLVLHTNDGEGEKMRANVARCLASSPWSDKVQHCEFDYGNAMFDQLNAAITEFTAGVAPQRVAYDMTPGKFLIKVELLRIADSHSPLLHLDHKWDTAIDRAQPFSQQLIVWRRGEQFRFPQLDPDGVVAESN